MKQYETKALQKYHWGFFFAIFVEHGTHTKCRHSIGENYLFFWKQMSIGDSVLVRDGIPLSVILSVLTLCSSCVYWHSLCEFICAPGLGLNSLFLWCPPTFPALTIFPPPLPQSSWSPEGRDLKKTKHLGLSVPKPLTLCTLSSCGSLC